MSVLKGGLVIGLAIVVLLGGMGGLGIAVAKDERFVLISHAPDSDAWWNTIKNAIKEAGDQMGVSVTYRNPPTGDLADMARIVEQTVAAKPDGIIISIADIDVLRRPLEKAAKKRIPVVTINSGTHGQSEALGALLHVGQPEYAAGSGAGKRAKTEGVTKALCVNHYITNTASVERCQGYADAIGVPLAETMLDAGQDPAEIKNRVMAFLRAHPETDGLISLGPNSALGSLTALAAMGLKGKIHFSTFDLSPEIAAAIKEGTISFAIDQQPFLQGYLPVVLLTNYVRYGVVPGNHINSGPGFVTRDNIGQVEALAGEYR